MADGVAEALSMFLLYLFKYLFGMEVPSKLFSEYLLNKEYQRKVFSTLFIKAIKPALDTKDVGRKRIFFLFNSFVSISGADIRFIEMAKRMDGFNKIIVTSSLGKKICEENGLDAKYLLTTKEKQIKNVPVIYLARMIRALLSKIGANHHDVLFSSSDILPDVFPAFLLKIRKPMVRWIAPVYHLIPHSSKRPGGYKLSNILSYLGQRLSLRLINRADLIITETNFLRNKLIEEYQVSPDKITAVQSGFNPKVIDNVIWNREKIYDVCFLARLHLSKGILDLIKAWSYVCKHKKDTKLAIAGSGSTKMIEELKREIEKLGLKHTIDLLGFLSEEDKYKLLKASKLYVLPSYEEGIPITFYEAMHCGLPVITYYLSTYAEIRDYIVSVPLGDVEKLAEEIIKILEDEDLARRLGDRGRKLAKEHTWDKVADCIIPQIEKKIVVYNFG